MGLKYPKQDREHLCPPELQLRSAAPAPVTHVIIDGSAIVRNRCAPDGDSSPAPSRLAGTFVKHEIEIYPDATHFVLAFDCRHKIPAIRSTMLADARYGKKLDAAPATMDPETHWFSEGKVWRLGDPRAPASAEQIEASGLEGLAATINQLLASATGKERFMTIVAHAIMMAFELSLAAGRVHCDACLTVVMPDGRGAVVIGKGTYTHVESRITEHGEADLVIVAYAKLFHEDPESRIMLRTIDTDVVVQLPLYLGSARRCRIHVYLANGWADKDLAAVKPKTAGAQKVRVVVDLGRLAASTSPERFMLVTLFGGDYVNGIFIRALALPKKALHAIIMSPAGGLEPFIEYDGAESVTIDWSAFGRVLATACKRPEAPRLLDIAACDLELQRIAYCMTYWRGIMSSVGGPPVDARPIIPAGATAATLLSGIGLPVMTYPERAGRC